MPLIRAVLPDPEDGHALAISLLEHGIAPHDRTPKNPSLVTELFGMPLASPVGLAAGLDKDARAIDALYNLGFSYVETGTITPSPQPGNPKPRYFRLPNSSAVINRLGFPSEGMEVVERRLRTRIRKYFYNTSEGRKLLSQAALTSGLTGLLDEHKIPRSLRPGCLLAINLGKMKFAPIDSIDDYIYGIHTLGPYADILVINISSPNTPGLRALQGSQHLPNLLSQAVIARDTLTHRPALCLKIAPDLSAKEVADVASAVKTSEFDGVIVSNTTIQRPPIEFDVHMNETGGLSGPPLKQLTLKALRQLRTALGTESKIQIIGCGGVTSGDDAVDYARAGASIVQTYTAFGYQGVGWPARIKEEITSLLGNRTWKSLVGADYV